VKKSKLRNIIRESIRGLMKEDPSPFIGPTVKGEWYRISRCGSGTTSGNACMPLGFQLGDTFRFNAPAGNSVVGNPSPLNTGAQFFIYDRIPTNGNWQGGQGGVNLCETSIFAPVTQYQSMGTGLGAGYCNSCCGGSGPGAPLPQHPPYNAMPSPIPVNANYMVLIWHGYGVHHWNIPQGSCVQNCYTGSSVMASIPPTYNCEQIGNHPKFGSECVVVPSQPGSVAIGQFQTLQACQDSGCEPIQDIEPKDLEPFSPITFDPIDKITQPEDEFGTVEPEIEPQAKITLPGCVVDEDCPSDFPTPKCCDNGVCIECPYEPKEPEGFEDINDLPPIDKALQERLQKLADIK
tara:strand:- start:5210 stop:6256 length:1047 start_codon:yes stop_codon:yes gene_type:complete